MVLYILSWAMQIHEDYFLRKGILLLICYYHYSNTEAVINTEQSTITIFKKSLKKCIFSLKLASDPHRTSRLL